MKKASAPASQASPCLPSTSRLAVEPFLPISLASERTKPVSAIEAVTASTLAQSAVARASTTTRLCLGRRRTRAWKSS